MNSELRISVPLVVAREGLPGRERATIGELAEGLQARHNEVVALASHCEKPGPLQSFGCGGRAEWAEQFFLPFNMHLQYSFIRRGAADGAITEDRIAGQGPRLRQFAGGWPSLCHPLPADCSISKR